MVRPTAQLAIAQHRGRLRRSSLRQIIRAPVIGAIVGLVAVRLALGSSLAPISRVRRMAGRRRSGITVPVAPPAAYTRSATRTSSPTTLASRPE